MASFSTGADKRLSALSQTSCSILNVMGRVPDIR